MPKTLKQILMERGQTEEQANAIIATAGNSVSLFESIMQTADDRYTEAETKLATATATETRVNNWWEKEATKEINDALSAKATAEAQAAFYRTQAEEAKKAGFIAQDAPGYKAPETNNNGGNGGNNNGGPGANRNEVPGSPGFLTMEQGVQAIAESAYLMTEHQRLFNEPLPDLSMLMTEATRTKRRAREVWEEKYKVGDRRTAIEAAKQKEHDDAIRAEERKKVTTEFNEKFGGTSEGRTMVPSRFPNYARDKETGAADKLAWTKPDKREKLRARIREQVAQEGRPN